MKSAAFVLRRKERRAAMSAAILLSLHIGHGPAGAATLSFQEDVDAYTGTQDTFLQQDPSNASTYRGAAAGLAWDDDSPSATGFDIYTLLRFDNIFGGAGGQVPLNAQITEATLYLTISDTGDDGVLGQVLVPWAESSTFSTFCGASCDEGIEHGPQGGLVPSNTLTTVAVNVTWSVQAWADGSANYGWFIRPSAVYYLGGVHARSSEYAVTSARPRLVVRYDEGPPSPEPLIRRPYLQLGTPDSVTVCWRSAFASDARLQFGTDQENLERSTTDPSISVDHCVAANELLPATRYYYSVGSTVEVLDGGTTDHYFVTSPLPADAPPFTFWAAGDCGTGSTTQVDVMNAMLDANGGRSPDIAVLLGDIAYTRGRDVEFTNKYLAPYAPVFRNTVSWPTLGNHDSASTISGDPGPSTGPYYDAFVLPAAAEVGGIASQTEAYYSFDFSNVHFVSLNSSNVSRSTSGPMATWLASDLASTSQEWVVAYFHHPPYSKGTHDSDNENILVEMRENIVPILEAGGVDLVLCGHSHNYERSFLIDGAYATPTPDFAALSANGNILDDGDGRVSGAGAYRKPAGRTPHSGTVYVVAGHGSASLGGSQLHPVMYFRESAFGSCLVNVDGPRLTLRNVRVDGVISDEFTIEKSDQPPPCDDGNPCTTDTYDLVLGCVFADNDLPCDDGIFCDGVETCVDGQCQHSGTPCNVDQSYACDETLLGCTCRELGPSDYPLLFAPCLETSGPGVGIAASCECMDTDADLDVDLHDFAKLQVGGTP